MDQPGRVANPYRGQLNRENKYFRVRVRALEFESRKKDKFGSPAPRQPAHLHTQAEYGAYLRDSSRVPRRRLFIYLKPPYAIGSASPEFIESRNKLKVAPNECCLGRSPWTN